MAKEKTEIKKVEKKAVAKAEKKPVVKEKKAVKANAALESVSFPYTTEKSIGLIEKENTLVFVVDRRSNKTQIKQDIERAFGVKVEAVRTSITQKNFKKAFVKLSKNNLASELAIRLGII